LLFKTCHLAAIALVIVSGKMEDTVESENFDLFCTGVSEAASILLCDLGGDRDVAGVCGRDSRVRGKGKHVGGHGLSTKTRVQGAQFLVGGDENIHTTTQPHHAPGARYETIERRLVHTCYASPQDNHLK
jgi:hypothetical protein